MKSLYLSWQAPEASQARRAWYPVGRLDVTGTRGQESYRFRYIGGAKAAEREVGFQPLIAFPKFQRDYKAERLFPLFQNRVMSPNRPDFPEYVRSLDLTPEEADPITMLSVSGGSRVTDNLHVFPKVEPNTQGKFSMRFFVHGLRYLNKNSKQAAARLLAGDKLQIMVEVNNPATRLAVSLFDQDYQMIGFSPRYLIADLVECIKDRPTLSAKVVRNNHGRAPQNQALLVEYSGDAPKGHSLMTGPDFTPLID